MASIEPPDAARGDGSRIFYLIPGKRGHWTARNATGDNAGYFIDHLSARRYALSQNGNRPDLVIEFAASTRAREWSSQHQRQAA